MTKGQFKSALAQVEIIHENLNKHPCNDPKVHGDGYREYEFVGRAINLAGELTATLRCIIEHS